MPSLKKMLLSASHHWRASRLFTLCGMALLPAAPARAALDGLNNENLPIVLLLVFGILVLGLFFGGIALKCLAFLFAFLYETVDESAPSRKTQNAEPDNVFEREKASKPPANRKSGAAPLLAAVWVLWVFILAMQCVPLWWRGAPPDGARPWSLTLFWGLLALFALLLSAQLAANASKNVPRVPPKLRQLALWFAPLVMTLALVYDTGTRHHLRNQPMAKDLSLADMRPLQPAELAMLPMAGNLQPGTCQMRLRKMGDPWTQALLTQTHPDAPTSRAGDTMLILGLRDDGPGITTQNLSDIRIAGDGIYRSDFQWRLFGRNIKTQGAQRDALRSGEYSRERTALNELIAASERQARYPRLDLEDPVLGLFEQHAIGLSSDMNETLLRSDWDCEKKTENHVRFCQNKTTGMRCQFGQYLGDLCTGGSRKASIQGKILNLTAPNTTASITPSKAWFWWQSAQPVNTEFDAQCALLHSDVIDAGARATSGNADLICPEYGGENPGSAAKRNWIKAELPYHENWRSQLPGKRQEISQLQAERDRLTQDAAMAPARLKLIEEAERGLSIAHLKRPTTRLWVRTLKSTPCTPAGQEVCHSFQAVLGEKSEPVVLEERCSDKATAARSSAFNTPMLRW